MLAKKRVESAGTVASEFGSVSKKNNSASASPGDRAGPALADYAASAAVSSPARDLQSYLSGAIYDSVLNEEAFLPDPHVTKWPAALRLAFVGVVCGAVWIAAISVFAAVF